MNTVPLQIEAELARLNVLRMVRAGGSGHLGGALSCIDIVTALYFATMRVNPQAPKDPNRDRFLLSAGHKAMAQYAVLGRRGYFEETLYDTYGSVGSKLGGHPDLHKLPGIEANTGALGHGLSIAAGMALGLRAATNGGRVFTVLGDGELPEGANWEGASIASHHRLDNLVAFVDVNNLQISGPTGPMTVVFASALAVVGGDVAVAMARPETASAVSTADGEKGRPTVVVARTTKAKGISFLEGTLASHYWKPTAEELDRAEREVHARIDNLREWNDHGS